MCSILLCGPGLYALALAKRGCQITGLDFAPAALAYAKAQVAAHNLSQNCQFIQQDLRTYEFPANIYDFALFIYGQLAVFPKSQAKSLLTGIAKSLKPGAKLCIELLDQEKIDKKDSTWWYSDDRGLWGTGPYLHFGERFWDADQAVLQNVSIFFI